MDKVREKAKELLESKTVNVIIGFEEGTKNRVRPVFITKPEDAGKLIFDERCTMNLAVYIKKHEVKHLGKAGITANYLSLRSILQLASENQIKEGDIVILGVSSDYKLVEFADFKTIENYISSFNLHITVKEKELIEKIKNMPMEERFDYWTGLFSKCIKCYACRAACSMCYCTRCTVECNQPQWIPVASHILGNLEWHIMRAMHIAGRCINCGACSEACPLDIPLHLLTYNLIENIHEKFGVFAGANATAEYALSIYKPEDKENFIL
ncbi:MAG: 4Fe-4S binding protein [Bacteroidota bacterium]